MEEQAFEERHKAAVEAFRGPGGADQSPQQHMEHLRTEEGQAAYAELDAVLEEQGTMWAAAIDVGIGNSGVCLSPLERYAVACEVEGTVDLLDAPEAIRLAFAERLAETFSGEALRVKVLAAYHLELAAHDSAEVPDGTLGRAVDQAIDANSPYAQEWKDGGDS
jgi:hypothetical protein